MRSPRHMLFAIVLSLVCAGSIGAQAADTVGARIAVLTWFIDSLLPSHANAMAALCISVSDSLPIGVRPGGLSAGVDPGPQTFAALPASPIPVRPGSACAISRTSPMPTVETATGKPAIAVMVGPPRAANAERATLSLQMRVNGRYGLGYLCDVARGGGRWHVTACRRTWIS